MTSGEVVRSGRGPAQHGEPGKDRGATLAEKGSWALAWLIAYLIFGAAIIAWERNDLFDAMHRMEAVHVQEEEQLALNHIVSYAILSLNERYFAENLEAAAKVINLEIDGVVSKLERVNESQGGLRPYIEGLTRLNTELQRNPSRAAISELRSDFHRLVLQLDRMTNDIRDRKKEVLSSYQRVFKRLTLELLALMMVGVAAIGGVSSVFFKRLSRDIALIKRRASEIVNGYRGSPLAVARNDELGLLMQAVNDMEAQLTARDNQLELRRQQDFHTEKMAAVGSLAAAVAHEINNPLAAIVGLVDTLVRERDQGSYSARKADQQLDLILHHAQRVMTITRQIGEFSLQRPPVPELVDLNALVRSTCAFVGFDKRFRGVVLTQDLASGLPAPQAVADHVVQVLMNVLINAADALEGRSSPMPAIVVMTRSIGRSIELCVTDNGPGIAAEFLDRVFDLHFTTKPPGRGSGLGLSLCRDLLQKDGGNIAVESVPGQGAQVRITLPVPEGSE